MEFNLWKGRRMTAVDKMRTAVGVPTYNGALRLSWLLRSIHLRPPWPDQIIVVDDGSPVSSSTRAVTDEWKMKLPLVLIEHVNNRGISAAWNTCVKASDCERVVLINDDVIVPSGGWLPALEHALDNSPGVGVVGLSWHAFIADDVEGLLSGTASDLAVVPRDPVSKAAVPSRRTQYEDTNPGRVMAPTGQLFAFRRHNFEAIGGFDEGFKSFYEESDFGTRMAQHGKIGMQLTWPFCWHMWSKTFAENTEALRPDLRLADSKARYRAKWNVPQNVHEFEYTNPKYLGNVPDVEVGFLRKSGPARGILRQDGAFVEVGA